MTSARHDFEQFFRDTRPTLVVRLHRMTGRVEEAHDIAQETYARAWEHWPVVSACDSREAWLHTVSWRLVVNRTRRQQTRRRALDRIPAPAEMPAPGVDRVLMVSALRRIATTECEAIVLHYYAGLPVTSIAERLGVPTGTVKARLSRGRASLARLLAAMDDESFAAA